MPGDPAAGGMPPGPGGERRTRAYSDPADRRPEPVYDEARRVARLRSDMDR
jgi:hypothetical protein